MKYTDNEVQVINKKLEMFSNYELIRYSKKPFPGYRHVPGFTPHPVFDPNGHSYGKKVEKTLKLTDKTWSTNETFLFSIDLFNYKYFWECHENLEDLWKIEKRNPPLTMKIFLQGIIQISAAYVKWFQGQDVGVKKLSFKGLNKLYEVKKTSLVYCGVNLNDFIDKNELFMNSKNDLDLVPPIIELQGL